MEQRYERDDQKIDWLESENARLRAEVLDLRQLLGPYSTVKIALKKYQEAADEATNASLQNDELKKLAGNMAQKIHDILNHQQSFPFCMQNPCYDNFKALYTEKPKDEGGNPWAPNKDVPAPKRYERGDDVSDDAMRG